ncbi:MAG: TetR family transcriptional regulator C-terminal domain-containing protein [Terrimicrobiaceae bacterium]
METTERITDSFTEYLREHGQYPESVYLFCRGLQIEEKAFFSEFGSFEAVESGFWENVLNRVVLAVESGPEWASFSARQRLLTFHFAFLEEALNWRSLMLSRFGAIGPLARPAWLRGFEARFKEFASRIVGKGVESGEIADRGRLTPLYPEALCLHLRAVIDFYLRDDSKGFERTDAFVEKSAAVAFDAIRTQALDSAVDLARFLLPRPHACAK